MGAGNWSRTAGTGPWETGGDWGRPRPHRSPALLAVFWVQVLLAGLVVPLLLGAMLTYTYHRCQPCKPSVASKYRGACVHVFLGACGQHG